MKNILYIGSPNSLHDIKWMSYFAERKETYKVFLLCFSNEEVNEKQKKVLKEKQINLLGMPMANYSVLKPYNKLKTIKRIRKTIEEYKIDLVHILFATPSAYWGKYIQLPYFITTRGSDVLRVLPALLKQGGVKGMYYKKHFAQFEKSFHKAKCITSTSTSQIEKINELFGINTAKLIKTGVDVDAIANCQDARLLPKDLVGKKFVFSPRFFAPIYNIEVQVEAIAHLPKKIVEEFTFVFIRGKRHHEPTLNYLKTKLETLQKEKGIKYRIENYLSQQEIWTYFNFASLSVLTPLSDGTPNSALEAMSAKCPLIIPNLNYEKELLEDTCHVLKENDAKVLAQLIEESLKSYPSEYIEKAFDKVNEFGNRAKEMNQLERLYQNVLS